jgi:hypothetical protein
MEEWVNNGNNLQDMGHLNIKGFKETCWEPRTFLNWLIENKTDRNGNLTGMSVKFTVPRVVKEKSSKNLISVMKGKKRDLARELMN